MELYELTVDGKKVYTRMHKCVIEKEMKNKKQKHPHSDLSYRTIEPKYEDLGLCFNHPYRIKPKSETRCSVGAVRVMRSGTRNGMKDDKKCNSCPKFMPLTMLDDVYKEQCGR